MNTYTLLLALLAAGCLGDGPAASPVADAGAPAATASVTPASASADTLDAATRAACASLLPDAPQTLLVVGRMPTESGELVRVAWAEPSAGGPRTQPETRLLYLEADACADPERAQVDVAWRPLRALHASPAVNDRLAALEIETEGGPEGAQREVDAARETSFPIRECAPGEAYAEALCVPSALAAAYRRAGLRLDAPGGPVQSAADLSAVPDSLQACAPASFRAEPGDVVLLGLVEDGPRRLLAFERFDGTAEGAAWSTHRMGVAQGADGTCEPLDPAHSDATSAATARLLVRPEIAARSAAEHVARAGGVEAYLALVRSDANPQAPYRCGPGQIPTDHRCLVPDEADAYRAAGVPVHPPRSF